MSQVSYGTITITDTTDLTTYIRYATQVPLQTIDDFQLTPNTDTHYIAVLSIPSNDSIPIWSANDWKWSEFIGTDGLSVKSTRTLYYLKTNSIAVPQVDDNTSIVSTDIQNTWTSKNPTYVANGTYWTCLEVTLSDDTTKSWSAPTEDLGLTQAAKDASIANSIAQQTIEDAQGAMSQATETQYQTDLLKAKVKNYWWDSTGAHIASGILRSGQTEADEVITTNPATYGFNSLVGLGSLTFGYNSYKVVELDGSIPALKFYKPSKTAQGDLTATLDSNGLVLSKGGIQAGCNYHIEAINNPSSENLYYYYELINNNYVKTEDKEIISGKTYYAYKLDDPTQEQYIYMSTEDFPVATTIGAGIDKNDWRLLVGTKFGVDNTGNLYAYGGQIGNEDSYINISEHGINIINSNLDISIESLNTAVQSTEWNQNHSVYELTNDSSIEYVIVDKPVVEDISSYYEYDEEHHIYKLTEDIEIITNKTYYVLKTYYQLVNDYINTELIFLPVENPIKDNIENYYELNNNIYIKTQDEDIVEGKTYYVFDSDRSYYIVDEYSEVIDKVQDELSNYYEKINNIYIKTTDTIIDENKTYYIVSFKIAIPFSDLGPYYEYITYKIYEFQSGETNPYYLGLYEFIGTESIVDFIGAHFNFTDEGLYVSNSFDSEYIAVANPVQNELNNYYEINNGVYEKTSDSNIISNKTYYVLNNSYKLLVGSDGVSIFKNDTVISKFGENIEFNSTTPQRIGGENSYIQFIPETNNTSEQIIIAADSILIGATDAADKLEELNRRAANAEGQLANQANTLASHTAQFEINRGYVNIDNINGFIQVGNLGATIPSYVQIDGGTNNTGPKVAIKLGTTDVAYMSGDRFFAPSAVVTNLYMKADLSSGSPTGAIGWVMRSNGHLSLKRIS